MPSTSCYDVDGIGGLQRKVFWSYGVECSVEKPPYWAFNVVRTESRTRSRTPPASQVLPNLLFRPADRRIRVTCAAHVSGSAGSRLTTVAVSSSCREVS